MIKEIQKGTESCFEYIFKEYLPCMYANNKCNYRFRWLIINWLKDNFFSEWIVKVIMQMKSQINTTTGNSLTNLVTERPVVLNDDDVNRMFGWALFKVQKNIIS